MADWSAWHLRLLESQVGAELVLWAPGLGLALGSREQGLRLGWTCSEMVTLALP